MTIAHSKLIAWLVGHLHDWGWVVVGWFSLEQQRKRRIHRLLSWIGEIMSGLMREPTNPDYERLLRSAERLGHAAMDFHNRDTGARFFVPMPPLAPLPADAKHNTREGHTALGFWLEWHRQQLIDKRDGPPPERRRRLRDERPLR